MTFVQISGEQILDAVSTDLENMVQSNMTTLDMQDVMRFEQAMHSAAPEMAEGNGFLRSVSDFAQRYHTGKVELEAQMKLPEISVAQLMNIQYDMMKTFMVAETTAKLAGLFARHIESTTKMQ